MFRTAFPSVIMSSRLYIQQNAFVKQLLLLLASKQTAVSVWLFTTEIIIAYLRVVLDCIFCIFIYFCPLNTTECKSYCSTVHFHRITSIYQPTNEHIISHKTHLKHHFKTLRHVSILSDHHQGALFLAKFILQYSQFNSYLQTRCCDGISCCVGMCCGAVARCASYDAHLATAPQHKMICCHNTSFANTNWIVNTVIYL